MPRQPILSVLGHVNAGKTSFLDYIRESRITEGEAGQITQMIGASEVPFETLEEVCGDLLNQLDTELTIPGLMFIDTPGHAAFSSLRKRGGSISDIAVLVIDIEEGVQPQTEEAIQMLKNSGTPFVIALNKVDKVNGWRTDEELFTKALDEQPEHVRQQIDQRIYELMGELDEYDLMAERFDRVDDFQNKIAIVPISAETGVGIPEILMVVTGLSQNYLSDELQVEEGIGRGTVLEVSKEKGMGTTIDTILYDGTMRKSDKLVYGTSDGAQETDIRALLEPRPLTEIRKDKQYSEVEEVKPAAGVKVSAKDLEGVISGAPVRAAKEENIGKARKEVEEELESADFDTASHGVVVKADSLGSLEALMRELGEKEINVQKAEVGQVNKSDIVQASNENESENRAVFAFNVSSTRPAEQLLENKEVKLFQSNVIYEIIEEYEDWKKDLKEKERKEKLEEVSRPAKIRIMPDHVFRSSGPAVAGTEVVEGVLKPGSSLMTEEGERIGRVKSIQKQNESIESAEKGSEVATSITDATIGRDIEEGDTLLTDISGEDYRKLKDLEDLLSQGEKDLLEKIVTLKDQENPHWKLE